jgi:hypothetical protein
MNGFIIRPFGVKRDVDFDKVERELISPALDRLNVTGRTTADIVRAGSIRADMFQLLLTADIVVADMSIHNANVFYELGIRHALRDMRTFLLCANIDDVPFDLKTDRYLAYDPKDPSAKLDALISGLAATIREQTVDSPVYNLVPGLPAPDPTSFIVVPRDFREEVRIAQSKKEGGDLRFLASELDGLRWKREGRRAIGEAQFKLKDLAYAAETCETVREELPNDIQANLRLGTIYQKLDDLTQSDLALERVISVKSDLAEAHALRGSNAKTRWIAAWQHDDPSTRQTLAMNSPQLRKALDEYRQGFEAEPRHYYSGLNALALAVVLMDLAVARPEMWNRRFQDEDDARAELKKLKRLRSQLEGAVEFSLLAERQRLERAEATDDWLEVSFADLAFLLGRVNVLQLYTEALNLVGPFAVASIRRQLDIFQRLSVASASVAACAPLFEWVVPEVASVRTPHVLVFTGHRVDAPNRPSPRFPANQEATARAAIRKAVEEAVSRNSGDGILAISGAASGGDLLFLEVCEELKLRRQVFLIIAREDYIRESVAPSGPEWIRRFNHQTDPQTRDATTRVYQRTPALPAWLQEKPKYSVWERSNLWMLHNALWRGGTNTTLIALWDGQAGDGPGGTKHMVDAAAGRGAQTVILDTTALFGLSAKSVGQG